MAKHEFGGPWTLQKLECLQKYLEAYSKIFTSNPNARYYRTTYVDAFAGTGQWTFPRRDDLSGDLFADADATSYLKGSARIALEIEPGFGTYIFVEKDKLRVKELEKLRASFPERAHRISIIQDDAATYLAKWCETTDWRTNRGVVFLDPYGMQVEWPLIECIAQTRAIDLWILFPVSAINRLLPLAGPPPDTLADKLTRMFGTSSWRDTFYPSKTESTLFGKRDSESREVTIERIGSLFLERLETVFTRVVDEPLLLYNSRMPLFLFCFASGSRNPRIAQTAVRIAQSIIGKAPSSPKSGTQASLF
jgi:three-Cys-motif partner protein